MESFKVFDAVVSHFNFLVNYCTMLFKPEDSFDDIVMLINLFLKLLKAVVDKFVCGKDAKGRAAKSTHEGEDCDNDSFAHFLTPLTHT